MRIWDSALSTLWAITDEPTLLALHEIYVRATNRAGMLDEKELLNLIRKNDDISSKMHLQSYDVLALVTREGKRLENTRHVREIERIAVIDLIGPIYPRANLMTMSGATSVQQYVKDFLTAYNDDAILGIVQNVDSPGGDARYLDEASEMMFKALKKGKKPVKTYVGGYMASAAYYLASVSDEIIGNRSSLTGSIGTVLTAMVKGKEIVEIVSSISPNKRPNVSTEEGRAVLQELVDDLGNNFAKDVARNRGTTFKQVTESYGKGKVLVGPRAKEHGLIDRLGTLNQVIDEMIRDTKPVSRSANRNRIETEPEDNSEGAFSIDESEEEFMGFADVFKKMTNFRAKEKVADESENVVQAGESEDEETNPAAQEDQKEEQKPTREELEEQFTDAAENFAIKLVADNRIYPAQQDQAFVEFVNAKIDDALYGGAISMIDADGNLTTGTREASVVSKYQAMPKHTLTERRLKAVKEGELAGKILIEAPADKEIERPLTEEEKDSLLALTSDGQTAINLRKAGANGTK